MARTTGVPTSVLRTATSATPPFAALPTAPGMARGCVQATLAGWRLSKFADVAELITSELVANAVVASAGVPGGPGALVIRVCLITDGNVLTVEVWDQAPGVPVLLEADGFAESGRGLRIIDTLTGGAWGCQPAIGQPGKCVWAEIRLRDEPFRQFPGRRESR
jgi:histidine kinase-like protein